MIIRADTVSIDVSDQDRALDFYTNKLGFEKLMDEPMSPETELRWIEVAPSGAETHVVLFKPTGQENRIGTFLNIVFACDDIHATYEELRGHGVEFSQEPTEQPWGVWAQFKDQDDNEIGLIQR